MSRGIAGAAARRPPQWPLPGASAWGEDGYGLWLEIAVGDEAGEGGPDVVQRLRWIEPGEFMMGSPADEPGCAEDEGPPHRVRLTRGFWLADTACTQAFWQAVMGANPSQFNDDPHKPVEQVSWDEVQDFLRQLRARLPGVDAALPSEAEWEYACRAGSATAYHWGEAIEPEQANYAGEGTRPVKSYRPNDWGLYEMHGNVWEWCADGMRRYEAGDYEDPRGPADTARRVVRGGSWDNGARGLRSAFRGEGLRGRRNDNQGFRFSLRSITG